MANSIGKDYCVSGSNMCIDQAELLPLSKKKLLWVSRLGVLGPCAVAVQAAWLTVAHAQSAVRYGNMLELSNVTPTETSAIAVNLQWGGAISLVGLNGRNYVDTRDDGSHCAAPHFGLMRREIETRRLVVMNTMLAHPC